MNTSLDPQTNADAVAAAAAATAPTPEEDIPLDPPFPYVAIAFPSDAFGSIANGAEA